MGNTLSFTLGLATEAFLHPLQHATQKLREFSGEALRLPGLGLAVGGLAGSFASLDAIVENVWKQIEHGAALNVLAKQTGESVKNLSLLESGFKGVRLSADLVGPAVFAMQRSLGGVNEFGEDTKSIFKQLGLDIEQLKKSGSAEALQKILGSLSGFTPDSAAKASSSIFGRGLGREMLQAARSGEEFAQAMANAAPRAEIFAKNAAGFERLEHSVERIKGLGTGFFLGIAEGAAPGISAAAEAINKIDLTGIGQRLGDVIAGLGEAIRAQRIGEVLELSMKAGIRGAMNFLKEESGEAIGNWMLRSIAKLNIGLNYKPDKYKEWLDIMDSGNANTRNVTVNPEAVQLAKLLKDLGSAGSARFLGDIAEGITGKKTIGSALEPHRSLRADNSDLNALERVGLVRLGGPGGSDYAQQTAVNTRNMIPALVAIKDSIVQGLKPLADQLNPFGNL